MSGRWERHRSPRLSLLLDVINETSRWRLPSCVSCIYRRSYLCVLLKPPARHQGADSHHPPGEAESTRETHVRFGHRSAEDFRGKTVQGTALTCQDDEQAHGHLLHDGAWAWGSAGEGPALAGPSGCHRASGSQSPPTPLLTQGTQLTPGQTGWP